MNISDFTYLLNNPTNLDKTQIGEMSAMLKIFHTFNLLEQYNLKD